MPKTLKTLTAVAFAFALAGSAQAEEMTRDSVVATVNGEDITLGHLLTVRATLPEQYLQLGDAALWDGLINQIVQQQVLAQDDKAQETALVRLTIENERRSMLAAEVIRQVADSAVTEDEIQAAYEAQYLDGTQETEYSAAHILVETEEEAADLATQARDGADFAELAREHSTGPSGPNGGELGWFGPGMMVAPFQAAVEELAPGDISDPVQTQFGWHVIKLIGTREQEAPALEEVREQIEMTLQQSAVRSYIDEKVAAAEVTRIEAADTDTSVLSNLELLEE